MSYDKIPEPQRRFEKRQICWCGNPDCPGEPMGGSFNSSNGANDMSGFNSRSDVERMREMMLTSFSRDMGRSIFRDAFSESNVRRDQAASAEPSSLRSAREAVKDYLLDVNHDTAWEDVVGNEAARSALMEAIEEPKKHPELYGLSDFRGWNLSRTDLLSNRTPRLTG